MMNPDPKYSALITLLRGSLVDFGMSCFSMFASTVVFVVGVILMTDDNVKRVFCVQPIIFLIAQSFTVTNIWRDRSMRQNYMVLIDKPTLLYTGQSVVFFVVALSCTIFNFATIVDWQGFYATSAVWVGISTLSLSKVVRDWNYADIFIGLPPEDHAECFAKVSQLCKGSMEFRIFVWFSTLLSCFLLVGVVWTWDDSDVTPQAKGFISVCALWAEGSSFHLCKIVREYRELHARKDLKDNMPFQFLIVFSCIVSHVAIFLALATHKLKDWQRMHLVTSWGFALTCVFVVARHVKDRLDIFKLLETPEQAMQQQGPYGNYGMPPPQGQYYSNSMMQYPMDGYGNQAPMQMQQGGPQYQQYEQERYAMAMQAQRQSNQMYNGPQAIQDMGQQYAARSTARNEQLG